MAQTGGYKMIRGAGPGRPKGSLAKPKPYSSEQLWALFMAHDFNPFLEMIAVARDPACPHRTRFECAKELAQYCAPKMKTVEHTGTINHNAIHISWDVNKPSVLPSVESDAVEYEAVEPPIDIDPDSNVE